VSKQPTFLWITCHVGAEAVLRAELSADDAWRPAFARPGLVTFKSTRAIPGPDAPRPHHLVRCWGLSLGRASTVDEVQDLLAPLGWHAVLQVQAGEAGPPGKVPASVLEQWTHGARVVEDALVAGLGDRVSTGPARLGDHVIDVIVRPDEPWMIGHHVHDLSRGPLPGGRWPLEPPEDAPSRAWAKVEELIAWSGAGPRAGQLVLEVGAAPGGATVALLDRGARVVSVDPRPYTLPDRLRAAPFEQKVSVIEALSRDQLPEDVAWVVVDVSLSAPVAVHVLERLVPRYRKTLVGCFATLKLNEWELAERIPELMRRLRALGFTNVHAANLPSFRQEIGVAALL